MKFTYQTRLNLTSEESIILDSFDKIISPLTRKLFALSMAEKPVDKPALQKKFKLNARHINSCIRENKGTLSALRELKKTQLKSLQVTIRTLEKELSKLKDKTKLHFRKRKLQKLRAKELRWEKQLETKKYSLAFGSKVLFNQQYTGKFKTHQEWKKVWKDARSYNIPFVGCKTEPNGNQNFKLTLNTNFQARIRLPDSFSDKYLFLKDIKFSYGHDILEAVIANNKDLKTRQPMFFRLTKDRKSWILHVTVDYVEPKEEKTKDFIVDSNLGVIGVDINADHLAASETDRFGNLVDTKIIPLYTYNLNKHQTLAAIGDAVKDLVDWSKEKQKIIILEDLDFKKKKAQLVSNYNKKYARMLSGFAYSKIISFIYSKAYRSKITVKQVNPAYTSLIGLVKFANLYGISTHLAAALVIGRRYCNFSESYPSSKGLKLPLKTGDHGTLVLPVRKIAKHVWSSWAGAKRKVTAFYKKHYQTKGPPLSRRKRRLLRRDGRKIFGDSLFKESRSLAVQVGVGYLS